MGPALFMPIIRTRCVQISAGYSHTVLLFSDGTVLGIGCNTSGQCELPKTNGFEQVSAGGAHTVLIRSSGDAMAFGANDQNQLDIPQLADGCHYTKASAGRRHTVLLRDDGDVVACGSNEEGQCNIPKLENGITYLQASAGGHHTVLLKSDGQALAVGNQGEIGIPAVAKHQGWFDWGLMKAVLPDNVEYVADTQETPVQNLRLVMSDSEESDSDEEICMSRAVTKRC